MKPQIQAFFDPDTFTISYVVHGEGDNACAIIDPVLDYDPKAGRVSTRSAEKIQAYVQAHNLQVEWILETHAHADHLSGAQWLKEKLGGKVAIGEHICQVQDQFGAMFDMGPEFRTDGSQFDQLVREGDQLSVGGLQVEVWHTPGHTPACVSYRIGDAVFVGDTLFMPDYGTARADFPGGDAQVLYHSIQRILALAPETRLFMCHDYRPGGREPAWETTVAEQRARNCVIHDGVSAEDFVKAREERDSRLAAPVLIIPSLQVNIRGGHLPDPHANGIRYLLVPLNQLGGCGK